MGSTILVICAITNLFFAFGLLREAAKVGKQRIMFSPIPIWFLATLIGGPLVVLAFWVIHFSNLSEDKQRRNSKSQTPQAVLDSLYDDGMLVRGNTLSTDRVEEFLEQK